MGKFTRHELDLMRKTETITGVDYDMPSKKSIPSVLLLMIEDLIYEYETALGKIKELEEELEEYCSKTPRNIYAELGLKESDFC